MEGALVGDAVGRHRDHAGAVAGRVIGGIRTAVAGGADDGRTACVRPRDRIGFGLAAGTGTAEAPVDDLGDVGVVRYAGNLAARGPDDPVGDVTGVPAAVPSPAHRTDPGLVGAARHAPYVVVHLIAG